MNKNKLLLITSEFPPQPGGIGNHAFHLAKNLSSRFQVTVLTDHRELNEDLEFDVRQNFKVIRLRRTRFLYVQRIQRAVYLYRKTDLVMVSGKFSVWIGGILTQLTGLGLLSRKRIISIVHGSELLLNNKTLRKWTHECLRTTDMVIAVSQYTASLLENVPEEKVNVIPNGFEIDVRAQTKSYDREKVSLELITVGNLTQRKGQHNVVQALPFIKKKYPSVQYHMVGLPTDQDRIQQLAVDLDISEHIQIHGRCSEAKKINLLKRSHIFLMTSERTPDGHVEGFGIAILEANRLGTPGIGSADCGIEDAINHGNSGMVVNGQDPEAIARAVDTILKCYDHYTNGAVRWSHNFSWNKIMPQYFQAIEQL